MLALDASGNLSSLSQRASLSKNKPSLDFTVKWDFFSGRYLEIILSPPSQDSGDDLTIRIACKVYPIGIHAIFNGFQRKEENTYMPFSFQSKEGVNKTIYLKVGSAAKRLLVSEEEIRSKDISQRDYLEGRVAAVQLSAEIVRNKKIGSCPGLTRKKAYEEMVRVYSFARKALKSGLLSKGDSNGVEKGYTYFYESGNVVVTLELQYLRGGATGEVYKVLDVAAGRFTALKKNRRCAPRNKVVETIMRYQQVHPDSHLVKVVRIREESSLEEGSFAEEYAYAYGGDISSKYKAYQEAELKSLCLSVLSATEEFEGPEIGYVYLDLQPGNILDMSNSEGTSEWKLTDFPRGSPNIKDAEQFEESLQIEKFGMTATAEYNTYAEIMDLKRLEYIVHHIRSDASVEECDKMLTQCKIPSSMHALLLSVKKMLESGDVDRARDALFVAYKQKSEQASVFQLGVILYEAVTSEVFPHIEEQGSDFCDVSVKSGNTLKKKLEYSSGFSKEFKDLIIRMLDPDPKKRPLRAYIKDKIASVM